VTTTRRNRSPKKRRKLRLFYPHAQEVAYVKALRPFADDCYREALKVIFPALYLGKAAKVSDALTADLDMARRAVEKRVFKIWPDKLLKQVARAQAGELTKGNRRQLTQALAAELTVKPYVYGRELGSVKRLTEVFVERNVELIKSVPADYVERIGNRVSKALQEGQRVETLAKSLEETFNLPRWKTELIARDQTGKFYGELNREQQTAIGVKEYVWETMRDERVRDTHADLDGETFSWDEPPVTNEAGDENHPGEDYQCRCTASGLLD
jgi:SPP1 gp7 family putative phage head morphogenesis protein